MRKTYLIVDRTADKITAAKRVGVSGQMVYDSPPGLRKGCRLLLLSMDCAVMSIVFALVGYFASPLRSTMFPCASVSAYAFLLLTCTGTILERSAKRLGVSGDISDKEKVVGPWLDPYALAEDAADVPGKRTYYIVDAERNAIVDVKHLGKWGQAYLAWRGRRQAAK